ncbi:MAG: glycosyltransferase family 2 protein [Deltaproteobacteria bacterium]|nr:glycosyltransferase family 2 protein [Deltaproteobacteria bacterium]
MLLPRDADRLAREPTPPPLLFLARLSDAESLGVAEVLGAAAPGERSLAAGGLRRLAPSAELRSAFPRVSIIVPTHARRDLVGHAVAGVLRNTPWPALEVLVVDDASTDGTAALLAAIAAREPEVRVLRAPRQLGFAAATNLGIRASSGEIVVLLNDDTVVGPGWLSRLVAHLEASPGLGMVGPRTNEIDNSARLDVAYDDLAGMERLALCRAWSHSGGLRPVDRIALFCGALRRSTLDSVGLLDERYEVGMFEDDDLCLALRRRGLEVAVAEDAFVHHVGQATFSRLGDARYLEIWQANRRRFERKWGVSWRPLGALLPGR